MMKHFGLVAVIFLYLLSCSKKQDIQESTNLPDEKDTYLITATQVGEISRGMTIHQLYSTFSSRQIKHSQITGGYFNQVVDNYDIYSPDGRILLTVTPEIADDTSSMINQIIIRDTSYQTAQGINLNSTLKDIRTKYHTIKYLPMAHQIVVSVPKISTNFLINKQTLNDNWWDSNAKEIIEENISDPDLNVNVLCEKCGMPNKQLYRIIKKYIGVGPLDHIRNVRLQKAAMLLSQKRFTVSEICYMVGFKTPSYFAKCFQEKFGVKPSQYQSDDKIDI